LLNELLFASTSAGDLLNSVKSLYFCFTRIILLKKTAILLKKSGRFFLFLILLKKSGKFFYHASDLSNSNFKVYSHYNNLLKKSGKNFFIFCFYSKKMAEFFYSKFYSKKVAEFFLTSKV